MKPLKKKSEVSKVPAGVDPIGKQRVKQMEEAVSRVLNSADKTLFPLIRHAPKWVRNWMHFLRLGFEFILPILLALYSMVLVFVKAQDIMRL